MTIDEIFIAALIRHSATDLLQFDSLCSLQFQCVGANKKYCLYIKFLHYSYINYEEQNGFNGSLFSFMEIYRVLNLLLFYAVVLSLWYMVHILHTHTLSIVKRTVHTNLGDWCCGEYLKKYDYSFSQTKVLFMFDIAKTLSEPVLIRTVVVDLWGPGNGENVFPLLINFTFS